MSDVYIERQYHGRPASAVRTPRSRGAPPPFVRSTSATNALAAAHSSSNEGPQKARTAPRWCQPLSSFPKSPPRPPSTPRGSGSKMNGQHRLTLGGNEGGSSGGVTTHHVRGPSRTLPEVPPLSGDEEDDEVEMPMPTSPVVPRRHATSHYHGAGGGAAGAASSGDDALRRRAPTGAGSMGRSRPNRPPGPPVGVPRVDAAAAAMSAPMKYRSETPTATATTSGGDEPSFVSRVHMPTRPDSTPGDRAAGSRVPRGNAPHPQKRSKRHSHAAVSSSGSSSRTPTNLVSQLRASSGATRPRVRSYSDMPPEAANVYHESNDHAAEEDASGAPAPFTFDRQISVPQPLLPPTNDGDFTSDESAHEPMSGPMSRELPRFLASGPNASHSRMNSYAPAPQQSQTSRRPRAPSLEKLSDHHSRSYSVIPQSPTRGSGKRNHPPPPPRDRGMISPGMHTPRHPHHVKNHKQGGSHSNNASSRSLSGYNADSDAFNKNHNDTTTSSTSSGGFSSDSSTVRSQASPSISRSKSGPQPPSYRPQKQPLRAISAMTGRAASGSAAASGSSHRARATSNSHSEITRKTVQAQIDKKRKTSSGSNHSHRERDDSFDSQGNPRRRTKRQDTITGNTLMYYVDYLYSDDLTGTGGEGHHHHHGDHQGSADAAMGGEGGAGAGEYHLGVSEGRMDRKLSRELSRRLAAMSVASSTHSISSITSIATDPESTLTAVPGADTTGRAGAGAGGAEGGGVPPPAPPPRSNQTLTKRECTLTEIVQTERRFVSQLVFVMETCTKVLVEAIEKKPAFKKLANMKYLLQLFDMLKLLRDLNLRFVQHIQESLTTQDKTIPEVFLEFAPFFKMYGQYSTVYEKATDLLDSLKNSTKRHHREFNAIVESAFDDPKAGGLDFESFLIQPVQRLPRYALLLRDLQKHTPTSHPDFIIIEQSLEIIESVNSQINQDIFVNHQRDILAAVCAQFTHDPDFVRPSRNFLSQASLERFNNDILRWERFRFFLFNDMVACASVNKRGKRYTFVARLDYSKPEVPGHTLQFIDLDDVAGNSFCFQVGTNEGSWILSAPTEQVKRDWLRLIEECANAQAHDDAHA